MKSIALVSSNIESEWISVREILANLKLLYQNKKIINNYNVIDYYFESSYTNDNHLQMYEMAEKITVDKAETIIFIDQRPNPGLIIKYLKNISPNYNPDFFIHIYGSFSHNLKEWLESEKEIIDRKISFIGASTSQKKILSHFMINKTSIEVCPFPVDQKKQSFNKKHVKIIRSRYNLKENEAIFIYAGRLSLQKNILPLCQEFLRFSKRSSKKVKLLLAGNFDDIGAKILDIETPLGYYYNQLETFFKCLSKKDRSIFEFMKFKNREELNDLYMVSNCFVSLSLHHDEDYGMAPRAALSTGCPVILTAWGGFCDLQDSNIDKCFLVPVEFKSNQLSINYNFLSSFLNKAANLKITTEMRIIIGKNYQKKFSIECCATKMFAILKGHPSRFQGFKDLLLTFQKNAQEGFINKSSTKLYKEAYEKYTCKLD